MLAGVNLPVEMWRVVLAYLPLPELGRCSLVCRAWRELILSLDNTRWRQLCLGLPECPRHPNWPSQPHLEPSSWREALRQHAIANRTWSRHAHPELQPSACLHLFRRRKERRVWQGALGVAGSYDRVVLHPGVYEEQAELVLKVPVEVVGLGRLGDVALLVSLEQQCPTARLSNLVFMPAWFSTVVYKTLSGHVQLDNCNFEGAQLQIRGPGTCHARFCSFSQGSSTHFLGVALSLLDSCDFSGSDSASVTVEGAPATERNWACKHLASLARITTSWTSPGSGSPAGDTLGGHSGGTQPPGATITLEDWSKGETESRRRGGGGGEEGVCQDTVIEDGWSDSAPSDEEEEEEEEGKGEEGSGQGNNSLNYRLAHSHHGLSHLLRPNQDDSPSLTPEVRTLTEELQRDPGAQALIETVQGCVLRRCLFRDGKGGVHVCNHGNARLEGNVFRGADLCRIVMLRNEVCECRASGVFLRLSSQGLIADNNIHSNGRRGLTSCNRIHSGLRSGIVVLGNGRGSIRSNQIYNNKEAGVYILFNGNPVVR
uniref:F-box domain-containing protein n=1 Tax=Oncorhynchus tshawytscha TaxID=74940 RepID=A0AAZ3RM37_ONCTS